MCPIQHRAPRVTLFHYLQRTTLSLSLVVFRTQRKRAEMQFDSRMFSLSRCVSNASDHAVCEISVMIITTRARATHHHHCEGRRAADAVASRDAVDDAGDAVLNCAS